MCIVNSYMHLKYASSIIQNRADAVLHQLLHNYCLSLCSSINHISTCYGFHPQIGATLCQLKSSHKPHTTEQIILHHYTRISNLLQQRRKWLRWHSQFIFMSKYQLSHIHTAKHRLTMHHTYWLNSSQFGR